MLILKRAYASVYDLINNCRLLFLNYLLSEIDYVLYNKHKHGLRLNIYRN
ncbi:hypothetical protein LCGC14_0528590 [marine sediment metagenome]|uniref:Uncharacterized protein n=1 Tax=marine sediment metagenome TaxID=412755 RepID=A0A0F9RWJ4_9ZZZZ